MNLPAAGRGERVAEAGETGRLPRRSPRLLGLFRRYLFGYTGRHFHAVRLSRSGPMPGLPEGPVVVVLNHPSWWDPIICLLLSDRLPGRMQFAPIDALALERYPFLERLGFFGVEQGTGRGARQFLKIGRSILTRPDAALWITGQGAFTDSRTRPTVLRGGIGHLVHRLESGCVVPLALEYPFWNESRPEALARFGRSIRLGEVARSPAEWTAEIARALEETQDALARESQGRDPAAFELVARGAAGVGGVYDLWRRVRAWSRGERFRPEHAIDGSPAPESDAS